MPGPTVQSAAGAAPENGTDHANGPAQVSHAAAPIDRSASATLSLVHNQVSGFSGACGDRAPGRAALGSRFAAENAAALLVLATLSMFKDVPTAPVLEVHRSGIVGLRGQTAPSRAVVDTAVDSAHAPLERVAPENRAKFKFATKVSHAERI